MIGGASAPSAAPPSGPQRNRAITRDDGSFELLVSEPGRYSVSAHAQTQGTSFPRRSVDVPDVEAFGVDLDYTGVTVAGQVVARETQEPVANAHVGAQAHGLKEGKVDGVYAGAGPGGRFELLATPGDYRLTARAEGFAEYAQELSVGDDGISGLRLELERGREISGRVVNISGQGVAGVQVQSLGVRGPKDRSFAGVTTLGDGSFTLRGLSDLTYNVCAAAELSGFACRTGVKPGVKDVTLTLQPGGRIRLLILGPDGAPIAGAYPSVAKFNGADVAVPGYGYGPSDATGHTELPAPVGALELVCSTEKAKGRATVTVGVGQIVDAEIRLTEPPDKP